MVYKLLTINIKERRGIKMPKKVFIVISCIFLINIITGCNLNNQGAADQRDNNYEQINYTPENQTDNVQRQHNNRNPFNFLQRNEHGGETWFPQSIPELEVEEEIRIEQGQRGERFDIGLQEEEARDEAAEEPREEPAEEETPTAEKKDPKDPNKGKDTSGVEQQVIDLTNQEREKNGLSRLKLDSQVAEAAQAKSTDMAENNYFAHNSPTYGTPFNMLNDFGVEYTAAAENIAAGQDSAEEVVQAWMNSEGHRKNILNKDVTHIGVGYEENGKHWTQLFIGK